MQNEENFCKLLLVFQISIIMDNFTPEIAIKKGEYLHYKITVNNYDLKAYVDWKLHCIHLHSTAGGVLGNLYIDNEADAFGYMLTAQRILQNKGLELFREKLQGQHG
ncbi:MAG: hypothetical protein AAF378_14470 [Cyanobacteria bacterium P01_A01_bin.84]